MPRRLAHFSDPRLDAQIGELIKKHKELQKDIEQLERRLKKPMGVTDVGEHGNENHTEEFITVQVVDAHAETRAALDELGHVNHAVLTTTLDTTWQGSNAPYTKTQTVNGLLATDTPIVDVVMSGTFATDEARLEAWGYVYRITTADNAITVYATEKPTVSLPIQLKVVR